MANVVDRGQRRPKTGQLDLRPGGFANDSRGPKTRVHETVLPFSAARKMNALHRCHEDNAIGVSTRRSYAHRMFELATHGLARSDIARVHDIIAPYIRQTPLLHASGRHE